MDPRTGELYTPEKAKAMSLDLNDLVYVAGKPAHVQALSDAVKAQHRTRRRAANRVARRSRKRNRR